MLSVSDLDVRCTGCNKLLAEKVSRPWTIRCGRCKSVNYAPSPGETQTVVLEKKLTARNYCGGPLTHVSISTEPPA